MLELVRPKTVLLTAHGAGDFSEWLLDQVLAVGGRLTVIDPEPTEKVIWLAKNVSAERFLLVLPLPLLQENLPHCDLAILARKMHAHGVFSQLELIDREWRRRSTPGVAMVHGIGEPFARRDFYRDQEGVPLEHCATIGPEARGVGADRDELVPWGFGAGEFQVGVEQGYPWGVASGVERFCREHGEYSRVDVAGFFGLAVLSRMHLVAPFLSTRARASSPLETSLEAERVRLLIKTIEQEYFLHPSSRVKTPQAR